MALQTIAIVVHDGVQALDVAGPVDVFAEANSYVPEGEGYETLLIGPGHGPVRASNGMQIVPDLSFEEAAGPFSMILVAGGPGLPTAVPDGRMLQWLREARASSPMIGSICTGAFALGHAGLLDGRKVATHWQNAQQLAAQFPLAQVDQDRIYLRDGQLITSAGVTAGIDLALALVGERHGPKVALSVAKRLVVVAQRQGGQSQFSPFLTAASDGTSPIARVQEHVMAHIKARHSVSSLASEVGMSVRHFGRLFVQETGITPHEFVERARLDVARNLLEGSSLPLKSVAYDAGFGAADRMRAAFAKHLGITPSQYRASFRPELTLDGEAA